MASLAAQHPEAMLDELDARPGPVTRFLFLRYRLQGFKVGADIPDQGRMIAVIS